MSNIFNYSILTLTDLIVKIEKARFWDLPRMVAEALKKINSFPKYVPPYKVYTAIISQVDTNPPTFRVLENTLELTLTPSYNSQGQYSLTPNKLLPLEKTTVDIGTPHPDANTSTAKFQYTVIQSTDSLIQLNTFQAGDSTWSQTNNCIRNNIFEIRIYN